MRLAITADSQARRLWDSTLDLDNLKGSQPIWKNAMLNLLQTWWQGERRNGSFRDSRQRRSSSEYLKRRRQTVFDNGIAGLLPEVKPTGQSPDILANNVQPQTKRSSITSCTGKATGSEEAVCMVRIY